MAPSIAGALLLATLSLTTILGRAQSNSTLPVCAESCAVVVGAEVACNVDDGSCCTNSAFIADVEYCVNLDCTTTEQQEATSYFDSFCGVSSTSGTSPVSGSTSATATTAKTTAAAFSLTSAAASTPTSSSGSGLSGFNGSLGCVVTTNDLIKIVVAVVGVAATSLL
ncbi:hypothetical protein EV368DRAFT_84106 [Lentinula lateritia]|uniref:Uncharacterized protein n=1 Tax=Lentinula aff. lateritia TaxID=2804960 RepID=A0ACC1U6D2_9AGAR|nr:hypothetical protein F5876DRAFT_74800 [Lentinula aff. lateritia]KAJ3850895.1 hypothetical protein EV368DRAFT_84106 [Lentinula lateritia]